MNARHLLVQLRETSGGLGLIQWKHEGTLSHRNEILIGLTVQPSEAQRSELCQGLDSCSDCWFRDLLIKKNKDAFQRSSLVNNELVFS